MWLPEGLPNFCIDEYLEGCRVKLKAPHDFFAELGVHSECIDAQLKYNSIQRRDVHPSGSMVVEVSDDGPGMSQDQLERLFGLGVQFNPNDLQSGKGSGLGLWISKVCVYFCFYSH